MAVLQPRKGTQGVADTTADLANLNGRPNYQVLVRDNGIYEWTATGPADGTDVFAAPSGFWTRILVTDTPL